MQQLIKTCSLALIGGQTELHYFSLSEHPEVGHVYATTLPLENTSAGLATKFRWPVFISKLGKRGLRHLDWVHLQRMTNVGSLLCVPVMTSERVLGVLSVASEHALGVCSAQKKLETFARIIAPALSFRRHGSEAKIMSLLERLYPEHIRAPLHELQGDVRPPIPHQVVTALEEAAFLQGAFMAGNTIPGSSRGASAGPARVLPPAWPAPELIHPSWAASESRASANSRASATGSGIGNPADLPQLEKQQQAAQRCSPGKGTCHKAETLAGNPECAVSMTENTYWEADGSAGGAYAPAMMLEAAAVLLTALSLLSTFCRCLSYFAGHQPLLLAGAGSLCCSVAAPLIVCPALRPSRHSILTGTRITRAALFAGHLAMSQSVDTLQRGMQLAMESGALLIAVMAFACQVPYKQAVLTQLASCQLLVLADIVRAVLDRATLAATAANIAAQLLVGLLAPFLVMKYLQLGRRSAQGCSRVKSS